MLDLYHQLKHWALRKCASKLNFDYLLLGDSSSKLAQKCLTDVSLGRGDQMARQIGLVDKRLDLPVATVRPLRDIDDKALAYYCRIQDLTVSLLVYCMQLKLVIDK